MWPPKWSRGVICHCHQEASMLWESDHARELANHGTHWILFFHKMSLNQCTLMPTRPGTPSQYVNEYVNEDISRLGEFDEVMHCRQQ